MDTFQALADPVRRDLLRQLVAGPARVVDLASRQAVSRPAVSRHLRILSDSGLVHGEDRGRERHYRLDVRPLEAVRGLINALEGHASPGPVTTSTLDALDTEVSRTIRDRRKATHMTLSSSITQEDIA